MSRSGRHRSTALGIAAGLAAFTATAALALIRHGAADPVVPSAPGAAPLAGLGHLRRAPAPGPPGPEGVPIPGGPTLAPPRLLHVGERIDNITCQSGEQVAFHIHAHLRIIVRGSSRRVPPAIGAAPPYTVASTPHGRFVAAASCFMWLHTHAADGIVHIESPVNRTYTLGEFFDIWGQPLSRQGVGAARGPVTALLNGNVFTGDPRQIPLLAHGEVELEVGRPLVAPEGVTFPAGL